MIVNYVLIKIGDVSQKSGLNNYIPVTYNLENAIPFYEVGLCVRVCCVKKPSAVYIVLIDDQIYKFLRFSHFMTSRFLSPPAYSEFRLLCNSNKHYSDSNMPPQLMALSKRSEY